MKKTYFAPKVKVAKINVTAILSDSDSWIKPGEGDDEPSAKEGYSIFETIELD